MTTTWISNKKPGAGWIYNQDAYTYNQSTDPDTGSVIYYNSIGLETQWTPISKP